MSLIRKVISLFSAASAGVRTEVKAPSLFIPVPTAWREATR